MKTRNPNANCGNCPYYDHGNCRRQRPDALEEWCGWPVVDSSDWCGQHPDFWAEEEAPRTDTEEWFPADYAPPKWKTVICDNGKEIYAGFRSEAVWYRLGFNSTYLCVAPKRWKPLPEGCADPGVLAMKAPAETDGRKETENERD